MYHQSERDFPLVGKLIKSKCGLEPSDMSPSTCRGVTINAQLAYVIYAERNPFCSRISMMAAAIFSGGARVPSPPSFATSMTISASSGSSYGSSMPVNPLILPALAALYSPLGSRCSQTY